MKISSYVVISNVQTNVINIFLTKICFQKIELMQFTGNVEK